MVQEQIYGIFNRQARAVRQIDAALLSVLIVFVVVVASCGRKDSGGGGKDLDAQPEQAFHADADIAMTVRSLADALKVGEPLDSADYDYEGILTDGQGRPIYTDIQGNPGEWTVDVLSDSSVVIRNVHLGDLLPEDLQEYVVSNLGLGKADIVESTEYDDDDETELDIYDFGGGLLRFEKRKAHAPNGTDAVFVSIVLNRY